MNVKKRALVVEGGAMRGIFAIGVLDAFIKNDYYDFDICVGVSAGSTSLAGYLAGMYGRNYRVTADYSTRNEFISVGNYLKGSHYMNLDWLWEYCDRYDPLDLEAVINRNTEFFIGVTSLYTGEVEFIKPTMKNGAALLKASCAMPIAYKRPVQVGNRLYVDGGIAEPIPIQKAIEEGANEIVVIRSRKKDFVMQPNKNKLTSLILNKYPKIKDAVKTRYIRYNESIDTIRTGNENVKIIEVNPPEAFKTSRFTKDQTILKADYDLGLSIGEDLIKTLN